MSGSKENQTVVRNRFSQTSRRIASRILATQTCGLNFFCGKPRRLRGTTREDCKMKMTDDRTALDLIRILPAHLVKTTLLMIDLTAGGSRPWRISAGDVGAAIGRCAETARQHLAELVGRGVLEAKPMFVTILGKRFQCASEFRFVHPAARQLAAARALEAAARRKAIADRRRRLAGQLKAAIISAFFGPTYQAGLGPDPRKKDKQEQLPMLTASERSLAAFYQRNPHLVRQ